MGYFLGTTCPLLGRRPRRGANQSNASRGTEDRMGASKRVVIIGGDAAGMSAASVAKRKDPNLQVMVFERGPHTSYSA